MARTQTLPSNACNQNLDGQTRGLCTKKIKYTSIRYINQTSHHVAHHHPSKPWRINPAALVDDAIDFEVDSVPEDVLCDDIDDSQDRLSEPFGSILVGSAGSPLNEGHVDDSKLLVNVGSLCILVSEDADRMDVEVVSSATSEI